LEHFGGLTDPGSQHDALSWKREILQDPIECRVNA
jgi:hypothetical protein